MFRAKKHSAQDSVDRAANDVANRVARDRRRMVQRRKWAIETAMMCAYELTARDRIALAKAIDEFVYEEGEVAK